MDKIKFLTATEIKFLAMGLMLLDHTWALLFSGCLWLDYIGRLAFPLFAFGIVEGYKHTSNFKRYVLRLLAFATISEIPFNLMYNSSLVYPFHQNVIFTLLFGLLIIKFIDNIKIQYKEHNWKKIIKNVLGIIGISFLSVVSFCDYGFLGVLMIICLYLFSNNKLLQLISMIVINCMFFKGMLIPITIGNFTFEFVTQGFAVLSLPIMWLYNGKKSSGKASQKTNKIVQYGSYIFYPAHMLILYLLTTVIL